MLITANYVNFLGQNVTNQKYTKMTAIIVNNKGVL